MLQANDGFNETEKRIISWIHHRNSLEAPPPQRASTAKLALLTSVGWEGVTFAANVTELPNINLAIYCMPIHARMQLPNDRIKTCNNTEVQYLRQGGHGQQRLRRVRSVGTAPRCTGRGIVCPETTLLGTLIGLLFQQSGRTSR